MSTFFKCFPNHSALKAWFMLKNVFTVKKKQKKNSLLNYIFMQIHYPTKSTPIILELLVISK